jgi:hypothetical protein
MSKKAKITSLKLKITESSGDGKRLFFGEITDDNFQECRMQADTDDADSAYVKECVKRIVRCVNALSGIEDPQAFVDKAKELNSNTPA